MEKRYQEKWNVSMIVEYCWGLICECSDSLLRSSLVNLKEGKFCNKILFNPFIFSFVLSTFVFTSTCVCAFVFTASH